jgi:ribosomal protein S18 acetylase RimI-like enzyme
VRADITVEPLRNRGDDLDDAAMVAARAFYDDPFFEYLMPRAIARARGLALFWRATIAGLTPDSLLVGARDTSTGRLLGVAAVMPPGTYPLPVASQVRQLVGAVRSLLMRPAALAIGPRYLLAIDRAHPKDPLWYLLLLVTDPSAQRSGIGTRLQEDMLAHADKDGLDCYLETQKADNLAYYRRFGYEVDQELRPVTDGPSLWTMRRSPR